MEQTYTDFEVWIIDANSTDGTQEYLKTLPPMFHHISEEDDGIYHAMNKGVTMSTGEWIYFLGADDELYVKDTLFNVSDAFKEDCKLILGQIVMNYSSEPRKKHKHKILKSSLNSLMWLKNTIHHQGILYHRTVFENRSYDETLHILSDYKLNLTLYKEHISHCNLKHIIAKCGAHGISKKYNWALYQEEITLKTEASTLFLTPLFYMLGVVKYFYKNL